MPDIFNEDFKDFLRALNSNKVEYLLVGGLAVVLHGHARVTGDMDIWVNSTEENYKKLVKAFFEFHMPVFDMTLSKFLDNESHDVFKFGRKPVAIDIMTAVKGLNYSECEKMATIFNHEDIPIRTLHLTHLLQAKKAAGRHKDLDDIEQLSK